MFDKLKGLLRNESGITALETAIILIAFVVVASVFAFTILSAGTVSTERGRAAIFAGLEEVEGSIMLHSPYVTAHSDVSMTKVITLEYTVKTSADSATDLTDTSAGDNKVVIDYRDESQFVTNVDWTVTWLVCNEVQPAGAGCDDLLEQDEQAQITIAVDAAITTDLGKDTPFVLEMKPPAGGVLVVERRTPSDFTAVMQLD